MRKRTAAPELAWDSGYWGRFTLATLAKPSMHSFPYSAPTDSGEPYDPASRMRLYSRTWAQRPLINAGGSGFPYPLRPAGWTRATDPFTVAARERLAERAT